MGQLPYIPFHYYIFHVGEDIIWRKGQNVIFPMRQNIFLVVYKTDRDNTTHWIQI